MTGDECNKKLHSDIVVCARWMINIHRWSAIIIIFNVNVDECIPFQMKKAIKNGSETKI